VGPRTRPIEEGRKVEIQVQAAGFITPEHLERFEIAANLE
jgi:hypothetical protein